jgi:hypothetical protein
MCLVCSSPFLGDAARSEVLFKRRCLVLVVPPNPFSSLISRSVVSVQFGLCRYFLRSVQASFLGSSNLSSAVFFLPACSAPQISFSHRSISSHAPGIRSARPVFGSGSRSVPGPRCQGRACHWSAPGLHCYGDAGVISPEFFTLGTVASPGNGIGFLLVVRLQLVDFPPGFGFLLPRAQVFTLPVIDSLLVRRVTVVPLLTSKRCFSAVVVGSVVTGVHHLKFFCYHCQLIVCDWVPLRSILLVSYVFTCCWSLLAFMVDS